MSWKVWDGQSKVRTKIVNALIEFGLSQQDAEKEATEKLLALRNYVPGTYYVDAGYTIIEVKTKDT